MFFLLSLVVPSAFGQTTYHIEPACNGMGFSGWLDEDGVTVNFESCETATGGHSKIWDATGQVLTETLIDGDVLRHWTLAIEITGSPSEEELNQAGQLYLTQEASVVAKLLFQKVGEAGYAAGNKARSAHSRRIWWPTSTPSHPRARRPPTALAAAGRVVTAARAVTRPVAGSTMTA